MYSQNSVSPCITLSLYCSYSLLFTDFQLIHRVVWVMCVHNCIIHYIKGAIYKTFTLKHLKCYHY